MQSFVLPEYSEILEEFSQVQQQQLMTLSSGPDGEIDRFILRLFTYASINGCSDVTVHLKESELNPKVRVNIRTKHGFHNFLYAGGGRTKHFKTKMLGLINAAQGGATSVTIKGRFEMEFPREWAIEQGLKPHEDEETYYINVRVMFTKTYDGVSFVCRIIDDQGAPTLDQVGMPNAALALTKEIISRPSGLVICTGPTGSGKSTLLHAMILLLNDGTKAISTGESPVEFRLRGLGQIIQHEVFGEMTWERVMEAFMRQHPDICVCAEILNHEIATACMQLAQTGHIVFATIHTEDAPSAAARLIGMYPQDQRDWASSTLAATLRLVLAPRLITARPAGESPGQRPLSFVERQWFAKNGLVVPDTVPKYDAEPSGKFALIEAMEVNYEIAQIINDGAAPDAIYRSAITQPQYETLAMMAARSVEEGRCSLTDCTTSVPVNFTAAETPSVRTQLAKKYSLSYSQVNEAIDKHFVELHAEQDIAELSIEGMILKEYPMERAA